MRALLACIALLSAVNVMAAERGDIVVANVHGDVRVTMAGATTPLYVGAILQLPATIRSGRDGSLELRQGPTTVAAAANTELEIPASAAEAGLIERIVQIRGNAFYNVGKREGTKLRVETPYLVAVIKGTQFNVAAQDDGTTIALFEGRLEVRASDDSDVVDLRAGQIALRNRNEPSIRTLEMNASAGVRPGEPAARSTATASAPRIDAASIDVPVATSIEATTVGAPTSSLNAGAIDHANATTLPIATSNAAPAFDAGSAVTTPSATLDTTDSGGLPRSMNIDATASTGPGTATIDTGVTSGGLSAGLSVGMQTSVGVDVSLGPAIDAGVETNIGGGQIDTSASATAGSIADVDANVSVGTGGIDTSLGTTVGAIADVGVDASVDSGGIDTSVTANAGRGANVSIDVRTTPTLPGADVSVDVETPSGIVISIDAGRSGPPAFDTGVDLGGTTIGTTIDTSGTIAAGVDVGDVAGVDVDLGTGTIDVDVGGNGRGGGLSGGVGNVVGGVGGVVGGLLGGRKGK